MTNRCPECGAPTSVDGFNCWEQLNTLVSWELTDPELASVRFLTAVSYNLQHPAQFTPAARTELKELLIDHIENETSVDKLRLRVEEMMAGDQRVILPPDKRAPLFRSWPMTISDVYLPNHPTDAAERVRQWANAIYKTLK